MAHRRKKKVIYWDRIFIAGFIALVLLWFIFSLFSGIFSWGKNKGSSSSVNDSSLSSIDDASSNQPDTINANYDYIQYENGMIFEGELILVNNDYSYSISEPDDLLTLWGDVKSSSYKVAYSNIELKSSTIKALNEMVEVFVAVTGEKNLMIRSGFRSLARQQELYDQDLANTNSTVSAFVAKSGHSEHHTGYAVDFGIYPVNDVYKDYDGTGNFAWINDNCYKYGFIVRYKEDKATITGISDEPWHFRYVGKPHAYIMQQNNLCFEEYIEYIKQYTLDGMSQSCKVTTDDGQQYEVYYVPVGRTSTEIPVPKNYSYSVSGNNVDGFIVTVTIA